MPPLAIALAPDLVAVLVALAVFLVERKTGSMPNAMTLPLVPVALAFCLFDGRWMERGIALAISLVLVVMVFRTGSVGGGALKLVGGLVVLLGWPAIAVVVAVAARFGIAMLARRERTELQWLPLGAAILAGSIGAGAIDYVTRVARSVPGS